MATRWKNTSEKWREINSRNRDLIMVLGVGAIAGGLFFLMMNIIYRGYYSDEASLLFFLFGNLSFGGFPEQKTRRVETGAGELL